MCLEVKTKQMKSRFNSYYRITTVPWFLIEALYRNCKNFENKAIVIQNGQTLFYCKRVFTTKPIATGYKENRTCRGGKKRSAAKICGCQSVMNIEESSIPQMIRYQLKLTIVHI